MKRTFAVLALLMLAILLCLGIARAQQKQITQRIADNSCITWPNGEPEHWRLVVCPTAAQEKKPMPKWGGNVDTADTTPRSTEYGNLESRIAALEERITKVEARYYALRNQLEP